MTHSYKTITNPSHKLRCSKLLCIIKIRHKFDRLVYSLQYFNRCLIELTESYRIHCPLKVLIGTAVLKKTLAPICVPGFLQEHSGSCSKLNNSVHLLDDEKVLVTYCNPSSMNRDTAALEARLFILTVFLWYISWFSVESGFGVLCMWTWKK